MSSQCETYDKLSNIKVLGNTLICFMVLVICIFNFDIVFNVLNFEVPIFDLLSFYIFVMLYINGRVLIKLSCKPIYIICCFVTFNLVIDIYTLCQYHRASSPSGNNLMIWRVDKTTLTGYRMSVLSRG